MEERSELKQMCQIVFSFARLRDTHQDPRLTNKQIEIRPIDVLCGLDTESHLAESASQTKGGKKLK